MIVDSMNPKELYNEILEDYDNVFKSLKKKYAPKYDKLRKKLKINKEDLYFQAFEINTPKKNKWIVILSKATADEKYKGEESINFWLLVYYYTPRGLKVFKPIFNEAFTKCDKMAVYNGHVFKRYNERMNLGLTEPLELVKHFFFNNGYAYIDIDNEKFVSTCRDGKLLGEVQDDYLVHKTFISKNEERIDQKKLGENSLTELEKRLIDELDSNDYNEQTYFYIADALKGIRDGK